MANSGGAARRLIEQGGAYLNGNRINTFDQLISHTDLGDQGAIVLRSGKKKFHKVMLKD